MPSRNGQTLSDKVALEYKSTTTNINYTTGITEEVMKDNIALLEYLPISSLMKTRYGNYKEYHTSLESWEQ